MSTQENNHVVLSSISCCHSRAHWHIVWLPYLCGDRHVSLFAWQHT